MRILAFIAVLPAAATLYFFVFWRWFDFWRKHRAATLTLMIGTIVALGAAVYLGREVVFADRVAFPGWARAIGWVLIGLTFVFGTVADRQLGLRVRAFTPFFEERGRLDLDTTGAYAVVRHPIYASGIGFQAGVFLVTGYLAVAVAWALFTLGAIWFTRREEERLVELLDDPAEYERYRARVPALFPWPRRRG